MTSTMTQTVKGVNFRNHYITKEDKMEQVPDAPWIRDAELNGMDGPPEIQCPVCGEDCETIYTDINGDPVGCNECITLWEADEWWCRHGD